MDGPLIEPDALAAALTAPDPAQRPAVLDVRWDLVQGPRPDRYAEGHLPGAVFVDLDTALAAPHDDPRRGRHPLPDPAVFIAAMQDAGVDRGRPVVVYDDVGGVIAARAWWLLRHYGHGQVAVLNGGLPAWQRAGHPVTAAPTAEPAPSVARGDFTGQPGAMPTLDADDAAALASSRSGVLLDARSADRFRGENETIDPAAGHIPGAKSRSTRDNVDGDGRFLAPAALADIFAALGATPDATVGAYCGSGVTAAHEVLALQLAGVTASLYPGSWSEWSNDPARPVATGA